MTLKQLETFYWICHLGSFVAAAKHLAATQSAVSMRIRDLESNLGVELLSREMRNVVPTAKGRELLAYLEQLMQLMSTIRHSVGDPRTLSGKIQLGVTELVAVTWLPQLVMMVNKEFPAITLELDVDLTANQLRKLEDGQLNLALIPGPVHGLGFQQEHLGSIKLEWMASPSLNIPDKVYGSDELKQWPLLTLTRHSNLHLKMAQWLGTAGHQSRIDVCNNIGTLVTLTVAGLGIAYLPYEHYRGEIESGRLQVIRTDPKLPDLDYFAVYEPRRVEPVVTQIVEFAQAVSTFKSD